MTAMSAPPENSREAKRLSYADDATFRALDRKRKIDVLDKLVVKDKP